MTRPVQFLALAALALVWGSSFILMKRGLVHFDPSELAAYRMTVAMAVLLPVALRNLRAIRGRFAALFLTGFFGNVVPAFLFALAQTEIPSSLSGMLNSLTSLFTLVLGVTLFRMRARALQVLGVLVALVGTLGLIGFGQLARLGTSGRYSLLVVGAAGCYGFATNIVKARLQDVKPHHITSLAYLMTAPLLTVYLLAGTDFASQLATERQAWWGVLWVSLLGIFSTGLAVILFNRLIQATTAVFAASVTYLIPVVAIAWGAADGERIDAAQIGYFGLILAGIFLINRPRN